MPSEAALCAQTAIGWGLCLSLRYVVLCCVYRGWVAVGWVGKSQRLAIGAMLLECYALVVKVVKLMRGNHAFDLNPFTATIRLLKCGL